MNLLDRPQDWTLHFSGFTWCLASSDLTYPCLFRGASGPGEDGTLCRHDAENRGKLSPILHGRDQECPRISSRIQGQQISSSCSCSHPYALHLAWIGFFQHRKKKTKSMPCLDKRFHDPRWRLHLRRRHRKRLYLRRQIILWRRELQAQAWHRRPAQHGS